MWPAFLSILAWKICQIAIPEFCSILPHESSKHSHLEVCFLVSPVLHETWFVWDG